MLRPNTPNSCGFAYFLAVLKKKRKSASVQLSPTPCSIISLTLRSSRSASIRCLQKDVCFPELSEWKKPDEVLLQAQAAFGQGLARTYLKRFPGKGRLAGRDFAPLLR